MIELEVRGAVEIPHPRDGENRCNRNTIDALDEALDEVTAVDGPAALVTVGDGRSSSNGSDVDRMSTDGVDPPAFLDDHEEERRS